MYVQKSGSLNRHVQHHVLWACSCMYVYVVVVECLCMFVRIHTCVSHYLLLFV